MRRLNIDRRAMAAFAGAVAALLVLPAVAGAQGTPEDQLRAAIAAQMATAPATSGAHVVDLSDGHVVFEDRSTERRLSASVTKLYTTSTALIELAPRSRVATRIFGAGRRAGSTWDGDLYLRGVGDFTFGTASFARDAYGTRASVERLVADLRRRGIRRVTGDVFGDTSYYSDNGGALFDLVLCDDPLFGPGCPYGPAGDLERPLPNGPRTPIGYNRGLNSATGPEPQKRPARFAARGLIRELRDAGISVEGNAGSATTPDQARRLADVRSPTIAKLVELVNKPSDNYAADSIFRLIGARLADDGSGRGGAGAVKQTIQQQFGLAPEIETGSGETVQDKTSPRELVTLLSAMTQRPEGKAFAKSLSLAGRNGTLLRFKGSVAERRCRLKDGTRVTDVAPETTLNISGYCTSLSGKRFAFAVMLNGVPLEFVPPDRLESPGYAILDTVVKALAGYQG
jgi:serine-type D-Ala-D-Ala carboxypeptidase/endopeptidase (penicillin-binding protein 4)